MRSGHMQQDMHTPTLEHFQWFGMYSEPEPHDHCIRTPGTTRIPRHHHPGTPQEHKGNDPGLGAPMPMFSYIFWTGLGLAFPGTLVAYASYALTGYDTHVRGHWPSVTSMIAHWPLVGCLTFGAGTTLLAASVIMQAGILGVVLPERSTEGLKTIVFCAAAAMVSSWGVVGSSQMFGMRALHIVHDFFSLGFLLSSAYAYACISDLLDRHLGTSFKGRQWVRVWRGAIFFFSAAAIACGIALAFARDEYYFLGRRGWKQALALSEVCMLVVYTGAYVSLAGLMGYVGVYWI
jgi:hypothetical protein